jgi:hypothetical protein
MYSKDKCLGYHSVWKSLEQAVRLSEKYNSVPSGVTYELSIETPERQVIDFRRQTQVKFKDSVGFMCIN